MSKASKHTEGGEENLLEVSTNEMHKLNRIAKEKNRCGKNVATHLKRYLCMLAGDKPLECRICRKTFLNKINLKMHYRVHSQDKSNEGRKEESHLKKHYVIHSQFKPFSCNVCLKAFKHVANLEKHFSSHTRDVPFSRATYKMALKRENKLKTHCSVQPFLRSTYEKDFEGKVLPKKPLGSHTTDKLLSCKTCKKSFLLGDNMKLHSSTHTFGPFSCSTCKKAFKRKDHLKRHSDIHSIDKQFSCNKCTKAFKRKDHLKRHSDIHTIDKQFSCNKCTKAFKREYPLKRHSDSHSIDKQFSCNKCMKSFKQKNHLKLHNRTHSRVANFACKKCGKAFKYESYFKRHLLIHLQNKDRAKNKRGKVFRRKDQIKRPFGANNPFAPDTSEKVQDCSESGKEHPVDFGSNRPKSTNVSENLILCSYCGENFRWRGDLRWHLRVHRKDRKRKQSFSSEHLDEVFNYKCKLRSSSGPRSKTDSSERCDGKAPRENMILLDGQVSADSDSHSDNIYSKDVSTENELGIDTQEERSRDCSESGKEYSVDFGLKEPKSFNVNENLILCSYCGENFRRQGDLRWHLRVHRKDRKRKQPFSSERLDEVFNYKCKLRSSSGPRSKTDSSECCDGKATREDRIQQVSADLVDSDSHSDSKDVSTENELGIDTQEEKSRDCSESGKEYSADFALNRLKSTNVNILCSYCGENFRRRGDLQRHLRVHRLTCR